MSEHAACPYTWTDVVHHQCNRTGTHTHHVCPCGAQHDEREDDR